jgi:hypothetical protein
VFHRDTRNNPRINIRGPGRGFPVFEDARSFNNIAVNRGSQGSITAASQMERATMEATSSSSRHVSEARTMDLTARRHCRTFHSQRIRAIMPSPSRAPARPFAPPHRGLPIPTARRTAEKLKADGVHERCQPFSMSFG